MRLYPEISARTEGAEGRNCVQTLLEGKWWWKKNMRKHKANGWCCTGHSDMLAVKNASNCRKELLS